MWLVVIFGCVLLHELAHCVVGRRRGAVVHEIELLPIGGVSKLEHLPEAPGDEFAMAIAGPVASVLIAVAAAMVALLTFVPLLPFTLYDGPLVARTFWFNLVIAGFNLLPAFPLDGGRVFRSLLERRRDLLAATRIAVRVGHAVAAALVVVGLFFNLWFVIIGVFVYLGASTEEAATVVHVGLRNRRVDQLMLLDPIIVTADTTVDQLQALVRRTDAARVPRRRPRALRGHARRRSASHAPHRRRMPVTSRPAISSSSCRPTVWRSVCPPFSRRTTRALAVGSPDAIVGLLRVEDVEHLLQYEAATRAVPRGRTTQ